MVTIDRDRIIQVMINLLSNAAKVNVDLTHDQQTLTICVVDNGPGIGLAICKGIIDHHKGKFWSKARPTKAVSFISHCRCGNWHYTRVLSVRIC